MAPQFVVTPWRDATELVEVRRNLFADSSNVRESAVNKVLAWRARKYELPLLLESTADIVEAQLRDNTQTLPPHALRLVYATAISRFVTGLLDTQTDLARLATPFQTTPLLPVSLRETRHRIVHRHLPSLAELKRAAAETLAWLWENYWSHLDALLSPPASEKHLDEREVKERLQGLLKTYVKARKAGIKSRSKDGGKAADSAAGTWLGIGAARDGKVRALVDLLVGERNILPVGMKMGSSMEGAYLIWTPFLVSVAGIETSFLEALVERMLDVLAARTRGAGSVEDDPAREGMCAWVVKILELKNGQERRRLFEHVLGLCLTTPTFWTLKLAEQVLKDRNAPGRASWLAILEAARLGGEDEGEALTAEAVDEMDVDAIEAGMPVSQTVREGERMSGPQKHAGLWRPRPIGWIPSEWSEEH